MKTSNGQKTALESTNLCEIIREHSFDAQIKEIEKDYSRLNELESAIDWALARKPERFTNLRDNYYVFKTKDVFGGIFPQLEITYKYLKECEQVYLIHVREVKNS